MADKFKCFCHLNHIKNENAQQITELRWIKSVQCSKEWLELMGLENHMAKLIEHLLDLPFCSLIEAHPEFGFHPTCYRRYIDSKRIYAAKKRKTSEKNAQQQSQKCELVEKRPRRSRGPVRSNPVLPAKCIICDETEKFVQDPISRKRIRDRLSKAETKDAGGSLICNCLQLKITLFEQKPELYKSICYGCLYDIFNALMARKLACSVNTLAQLTV